MRRLRGGDQKAFEMLYEKFAGKIYHVSRKMHLDHEDAESLVQEVFLKIWTKRQALDPDRSFNAYLLTIVRSMVIKEVRHQSYMSAYQQYVKAHKDLVNETEDYIVFRNFEELSNEVLNQLPAKQKQIFMMKNIEEYSIEEIATSLDLSKRTVENQVYRATKVLKEKLTALKVIGASAHLLLIFLS